MADKSLISYSPEWLNNLGDEEKRALHCGPFAKDRHMHGAAHTTWFIWITETPCLDTGKTFQQGSAFLLNCGKGTFAVTAGHVYAQFYKDKTNLGVKGCQIGNRMFNPEERLIECGTQKNIDIATFALTDEDIAAIGKMVVSGSDGTWPPAPKTQELAYIGGYPAAERISLGGNEVSFGQYGALIPTTGCTEYQITCRFDRASWVDALGRGFPEQGYKLGGMSGGPMLIPDYKSKNRAWDWRLGGVISQAESNPDYEIVTAVRAHHILPDGRLRL